MGCHLSSLHLLVDRLTCSSLQESFYCCILRSKLWREVSVVPINHQGPYHVPTGGQLALGILDTAAAMLL
jgi:hypothetical protein